MAEKGISAEEALAIVKMAEEEEKEGEKHEASSSSTSSEANLGRWSQSSLDKRERKKPATKEPTQIQPEQGSIADLRGPAVQKKPVGERVFEDVEVRSCASQDTQGARSTSSFGKKESIWVVKNPPNLGKRLGVDWHWTVQVENEQNVSVVPGPNMQALVQLKQQGYYLVLLSYCHKRREQEVRQACAELAKSQAFSFDELQFTRSVLGPAGKSAVCQRLQLTTLFDDREDVCKDALTKGIDVYPIVSPKSQHLKMKALYETFAKAVEAFLSKESLKTKEI